MKRLCVFYKHADWWLGKKVEWIVCKECQRLLSKGKMPVSGFTKATKSTRCSQCGGDVICKPWCTASVE